MSVRACLVRSLLLLCFASLTTAAGRGEAATIAVSDTCALEDAIIAANANGPRNGCTAGTPGGDVITIPADTTITLWRTLPAISEPVTIAGLGSGVVIERAAGAAEFRLLQTVHAVALQVTLRNLTLRGGRAGSGNGGALLIYSSQAALIEDVTFEDNAAMFGGAVSDSLYWAEGADPAAGAVTIRRSRFAGNQAAISGGAVTVNPGGALRISDSTFDGNAAGHSGGAVLAVGGDDHPRQLRFFVDLTVERSRFERNLAWDSGGAIAAWQLTIADTTFADNQVTYGGGGALYSYGGHAAVAGSTFARNRAVDGGALVLFGEASGRIVNSTFSGNAADDAGGAIRHGQGVLTLNNVTIAGNTADTGPSVAVGEAQLILGHSIVAGNAGTSEVADVHLSAGGQIASYGYNLVGIDTGAFATAVNTGDRVGTPAMPLWAGLLPLAANGGPTDTHALEANSPAIDAGNSIEPGSRDDVCEATDQRGQPRPGPGDKGTCDIGAYERRVTYPLTIVVTAGGSVRLLETGDTCTSACTFDVPVGATVTLSAVPAERWRFDQWTDDCAANASTSCEITMTGAVYTKAHFVEDKFATTVKVKLSPLSITAAGRSIARAYVTSDGGVVPTGTLTFRVLDRDLPTAVVDGYAWLLIADLLPGSYEVIAIYGGDAYSFGSTGQGTLTVTPIPTTVGLVSSPNPAALTQNVTFTATVTPVAPAATMPTGQIDFIINGAIVHSQTLDAAGRAAYTRRYGLGTVTVTAAYRGDARHAASAATATNSTIAGVPPVARITMQNGAAVPWSIVVAPGQTATLALTGATSSDPDGAVGAGLTYAWSTTAGQSGSGALFNAVLPFGTYHISLTVRDPQGLTHTTSVKVVVSLRLR